MDDFGLWAIDNPTALGQKPQAKVDVLAIRGIEAIIEQLVAQFAAAHQQGGARAVVHVAAVVVGSVPWIREQPHHGAHAVTVDSAARFLQAAIRIEHLRSDRSHIDSIANWWHLDDKPLLLGVLSIAIFMGKVLFFMFVFMWVRWTVPRFRYDQVMKLGWQKLLPLAIGNLLLYALIIAWLQPKL